MKMKGIIAFSLILAIMLGLAVVASAESSINHNIPSGWVTSDAEITITPSDADGIAYMYVNSVSVLGNRGKIAQGGTPYYKIKKASETDSALTISVSLGNISAKAGQFAFKFTDDVAYSSITASTNVTLIEQAPSAYKKGSFYVDTTNRVGYATWYSADSAVDATYAEKELFTLTFAKSDSVDTYNFKVFADEPTASELTNPAIAEASVIQTESGSTVTSYCTSANNLDYVIELDGDVYVDNNTTAFSWSGTAGNAIGGQITVKVGNMSGVVTEKSYTVNIDNSTPSVSFDALASSSTSITALNFSVGVTPASGVTYKAELIKGGVVVSTKDVTGPSVLFDNLEDGIYTVKVTATTGTGKTDSKSVVVLVGDGPLFIYGDLNSDNKADILDAVILEQYLADWPLNLTEAQLLAADVYKDDVIDINDAIYFKQYLADWPDVVLGQEPANK